MKVRLLRIAANALTLSLAITSLLLAGGCHNKRPEPAALNALNTVLARDAISLDPAQAYDTSSLAVVGQIYDGLFQFHYLREVPEVVPLLAADLPRLSADQKTVTIRIRKGIRFQNDPCFGAAQTRELKSNDFLYAWKRLALPELQSPGSWFFESRIVGYAEYARKLRQSTREQKKAAFALPIRGLSAPDPYTLQIQLLQPDPQLTMILSLPFSAPVPIEAVNRYAAAEGMLYKDPVGTGPFKLKTWHTQTEIVLERNLNYYPDFYPVDGDEPYRQRGLLADAGKPLPFLDQIIFRILSDAPAQWKAFRQGTIDHVIVHRDQFQKVVESETNLRTEWAEQGIRLAVEAPTKFFYLSFNLRDQVVGNNKLLRQALSSAIDRQHWIEAFSFGRGVAMNTATPQGFPDRTETTLKYGYDLTRAKALLVQAGYPGGDGLPTLRLDLRGNDLFNRQLGEFFKAEFSKIGVKLNYTLNTFAEYLEKSKSGKMQIGYGGWGIDYPDPENIYQLLYGGTIAGSLGNPNSETFFNNTEYNLLFQQLATQPSGAKRKAIAQKMEAIIQEELPWAYGYFHSDYWVIHPWLQNELPSRIALNRFKYLRKTQMTHR